MVREDSPSCLVLNGMSLVYCRPVWEKNIQQKINYKKAGFADCIMSTTSLHQRQPIQGQPGRFLLPPKPYKTDPLIYCP